MHPFSTPWKHQKGALGINGLIIPGVGRFDRKASFRKHRFHPHFYFPNLNIWLKRETYLHQGTHLTWSHQLFIVLEKLSKFTVLVSRRNIGRLFNFRLELTTKKHKMSGRNMLSPTWRVKKERWHELFSFVISHILSTSQRVTLKMFECFFFRRLKVWCFLNSPKKLKVYFAWISFHEIASFHHFKSFSL